MSKPVKKKTKQTNKTIKNETKTKQTNKQTKDTIPFNNITWTQRETNAKVNMLNFCCQNHIKRGNGNLIGGWQFAIGRGGRFMTSQYLVQVNYFSIKYKWYIYTAVPHPPKSVACECV